MHPEPDDPRVVARMRSAHYRARTALDARLHPGGREVWGWHGRTLGRPVITPDGPAWLRLAAASLDRTDSTFWNGSRDAKDTIPEMVPRPRLRTIHDWNEQPWRYRAELYDHVGEHPAATSPSLTTDPNLPASWWTSLRTALDTITTIPTDRHTTDQQYLDWAMPKFLSPSVNTRAPSWSTAHGDLHWANLCAPQLTMLDWEGWGLAPTGYDAATLHSYSLLVPDVAWHIRNEFADVLNTPAGRFAELAVITELLESTTHGDNLPLAEPLRRRAAHLLRDAAAGEIAP
jgi:hypothetical protein